MQVNISNFNVNTGKAHFFILYLLVFCRGILCSSELCGLNIISGLIVFTMQVSLGDGTLISNANLKGHFAIAEHADGLSNDKAARDPRILKDLSKLNPQGCLAKMLCGVEVARPPSDGTSTINDYAYLVKTFFDTFSFSGLSETLADDIDDIEGEEAPPQSSKKTRNDIKSRKKKKKGHNAGSLASQIYKEQSLRDKIENQRIEQIYQGMSLDELLDQQDSFLDFRKRMAASDLPKTHITYNRLPKITIRNPRYDKSMYLNRKQREFSMATNETQKLDIAREVGNKLRRGRQCRAIFNTGFSFCPWTSTDLQNMLLNRTSPSTTTTTTRKPYVALKDVSPYLYKTDYNHLKYMDDEFPTAFKNPTTVLVETERSKYEPFPTDGKAILTYDPRTKQHAYSYITRTSTTTTEKPRKRKPKEESKEISSESSEEEAKDSAETPRQYNSNEYYNNEESVENEQTDVGPPTQNYYASSDEYSNNESEETQDPKVPQDDEEEDYMSWSDPTDSPAKDTKPKKGRKTTKVVKKQPKESRYSVAREAMKFSPPDMEKEYMSVAEHFAKSTDQIISHERFLSGLPHVWDPNEEKWQDTTEKRSSGNSRGFSDKKVEEKSQESESSEEVEEYDNADDEIADDEIVDDYEEEVPEIQEEVRRIKPSRPLIRFRLPKFRGRRSTTDSKKARDMSTNITPLPPDMLISKLIM